MKSPLRYQITEFDCGSVSLLNCITYLFDREEIPAELVKAISTYTLDCYDEYGNLGQKGTSKEAVRYLSQWLTNFSKSKNFGITVNYLSGNEVSIDKIQKCIKNGGCVNFRTYQECEHYVTITDIDDDFVYIFDPYYCAITDYDNDSNIEIVTCEPFKFNRKVKIKRFMSKSKNDFALGPINNRECLLINKK